MNTADTSSRSSGDKKPGLQQAAGDRATWSVVDQHMLFTADPGLARTVTPDGGRRPSGSGSSGDQAQSSFSTPFPSVLFSPAHLAAGSAAAYGNVSTLQQQQLLQQCLTSPNVASSYAAMLVNLQVDRAQLVSQMSRNDNVNKSSLLSAQGRQPRSDALGSLIKVANTTDGRASNRGNGHGGEPMESSRLLADSAQALENARKRLSSDRPLSSEGQGQVEDGYLVPPLTGKVKRRLMSEEQARASGHHSLMRDNDLSARLVASLPAADLKQLGVNDKVRLASKQASLASSSRALDEEVKVENTSISPSQGAQPHYPAHFYSGSLIQLATGAVKKVEDLCTEDFVASAGASPDLKIDSCVVVRMEPVPQRDTVMLGFCIGEQRFQVTVEATLEHPFFVYSQGWASCSPQRTFGHYGLRCEQLSVGDVCVSLTNRLPLPLSTPSPAPPPQSAFQRPSSHGNGLDLPPQSSTRREVSQPDGHQYELTFIHQSTTHASPTLSTQPLARRLSKDTVTSQFVASNGPLTQSDYGEPAAAAVGHWVEQRTRKRSFSAPDLHENDGEGHS